MNNKEMLDVDTFHDALEAVILNIREDTEDRVNKIDKKLDKLIEVLEKII